jgi:hypothetical protein
MKKIRRIVDASILYELRKYIFPKKYNATVLYTPASLFLWSLLCVRVCTLYSIVYVWRQKHASFDFTCPGPLSVIFTYMVTSAPAA